VTTTSTFGEKDEPLELITPYEALPSLLVTTGTPWAVGVTVVVVVVVPEAAA
jgi:hypothetical protein